MATILYKGKTPRLVAGKFMYTDDVRELNPKLAKDLAGDPNFVITWKEGEVQATAVEKVLAPVANVEVPTPEPGETIMPDSVDETVTPEKVEEVVKPPKATKRGKRKS